MTYDDLAKIIVLAECSGMFDNEFVNGMARTIDKCKGRRLPALEAYKKVKPQFKEIEKKLKGDV
jgi:hypothetical protein